MLAYPFKRLGGLSQLVLGGVALVAHICATIENVAFASRAVRTEAEIIRLEKGHGKGGGRNHPVYVYQDTSGRSWEGTLTDWSNELRVGQKMEVFFDPMKPMKSSVDTSVNWAAVALLAFWAIGMAIAGWNLMLDKKTPNTELSR